ncbi:NADH-quinone oxidoreductase subunit L [Runella slithyformis]|uniref:Proton-translocating NADH-quinone oxidoreductase, chain L n=1 Tax=Runella slithyformis (strain ATCC 29530 / DSM 19594 / LMG 11500 / NCIMB 11436 / LSU 4) TaxID=761193 RepID=A0A7U4E8I2_RUNSL|nr:NADH-quinone oxidoreductase subunit L [Runella slithyformis]AEI51474.1 proton-translocating NADH-quinone oxidoreductase, chain L [Runella slithyformis DSM 19594]
MSLYLLLLLIIPFVGFVGLFSLQKRADHWAGYVGTVLSMIGMGCSLMILSQSLHQSKVFLMEWFSISGKPIMLSLLLDNQTLLMLVIVHFVAILVQIFSITYMHDEPARWRYFAFLQLFVFSMLGIVLAGSLLLMYVFWELVGLSSYLLIGFWYDRPRAVWAAKKAFLLNRIGDAGFLTGILLLFWQFGTTEFSDLILHKEVFSGTSSVLFTGIGVLLFCGAIGKSAQFPLSGWLPDAMEGPTPVSALIHAATMVAAGIFLLGRIHSFLTPDALIVVTIIGTVTMVAGAYHAIFQTDIKKLLAYSTVSQLGLMVMGMGVGAKEAALFHLMTHAFFKAGLFLCAGVIIHAVHTQDTRQMGGLRQAMPVTFWAYTACAAALAGIPFFSGFLSKDAILIGAFAWADAYGSVALIIPIAGITSAGLTAFYVIRQWRQVFFGMSKIDSSPHGVIHDADNFMKIPIVLTAILSFFMWFSYNPLDASHGWFFQMFSGNVVEGSHGMVALLSMAVVAVGLLAGYCSTTVTQLSGAVSLLKRLHDTIHDLLLAIFGKIRNGLNWLNEHSGDPQREVFLIAPLQKVAQWTYVADRRIVDVIVNGVGYLTVIGAHVIGRFDRLVIDGVVNGLAWLAGFLGNRIRNLQNGSIQSYFVVMLLGVLLLIYLFF